MVQALSVAPAATTTLQEFILAAHFRAPLPLGVMDLANWVSSFPDFPLHQELPPLTTANMPAIGAPEMPAIEFGMGTMLPRMLLRSHDGRYTLQLQNDRLAFGWSRIEPIGVAAEYPGFETMLAQWTEMRSRVEDWVEGRFRARPLYRLVEVNYLNAAPLEVGGKQRRISEILRFGPPAGRLVHGFNVQWGERVYQDPEGEPPRGIVRAAVGLAQAPPAIPVLTFNFSGMAAVADGQESNHIINDLHAKIREIYQSAMISDAH
ncbi:TIGR04255 family protein [Bradyrhizobium sp. BRP23]|uniref:TIGR04255 family protein n=1 Tax=Bradyrhizobium sp. BRP23 TaxID=2793820 RepID=UPI001CD41153|nr:TIGR04255 family protein [Bradyrhizobium sp. BRP23]MCA1381264.1 TIGR04255 family protein [Bradyrhizobium sp. BRP05]MCA1418616.1 TIGR04255 family protein [Bradyrhizobium sp. BRP23]